MAREYKLACVVGRFQPFHKGHKKIIDKALEIADRVVVCLGSCNDVSANNPFTFNYRSSMVDCCYEEDDLNTRIQFVPLVDLGVGNSPVWGNYIKNACKFYVGREPDVYVQGSEEDRSNWGLDAPVIVVDRNELNISGTMVRSLIEGNLIIVNQKLEEIKPLLKEMHYEDAFDMVCNYFDLCSKNLKIFVPDGAVEVIIDYYVSKILYDVSEGIDE